jgi:hypothetical protein
MYNDKKGGFPMNKEQFLKRLEELNLPKDQFVILSGGSLLMRGIRKQTADLDLCASKELAKKIKLYDSPVDDKGFYTPFEGVQMLDDMSEMDYDEVDGYLCESLSAVIAFKRKKRREKDLKDLELIEKYLLDKLKIHGIYRHFKGDLYIVEDVAYNSETDEPMVVYRALYGDGQLWCRPLDMFLSPVDRKKYPNVKQKNRCELQDIKSVKK